MLCNILKDVHLCIEVNHKPHFCQHSPSPAACCTQKPGSLIILLNTKGSDRRTLSSESIPYKVIPLQGNALFYT